LIWNSCFNPSATVSFTCMASIFFPLGPAETPGNCQIWSTHGLESCVEGSARPHGASCDPKTAA
jgi:hypothetical protein